VAIPDRTAHHRTTAPAVKASRDLPPFARLAIVHGLSSAGDAVVAVALAGSIFFDVKVTAAQSRVALSLALTVAPFAIVGPLLGPLVERARGGRRAMAIIAAAGRAVCCLFMAYWAHSLALFPVAFFTLVFSKLYLVTKAALVPGAVDRSDQLVLANSKLSVGGSVAGMVAGLVGAGLLALLDAPWVLRFDIVVYLACTWGATRLRSVRRPPAPGGPAAATTKADGPATTAGAAAAAVDPLAVPSSSLTGDPASASGPGPGGVGAAGRKVPPGPQLHGLPPGGLQLAAVATAGLRAVTGFVTFLLVFTFRRDSAALIWYGLALGASQVGNVAGALLAPQLRRRATEEWMLTASSVVVGTTALLAGAISWGRHWPVAVVLAAGIGLAAASGKLAFDSMVQRDVPARVRGRSFARFESGFQLSWAMGSLLAVLVRMTLSAGFVAVGFVGLLGALAFAQGSKRARRGTLPAWWPGSAPRPVPPPPGPGGS
jgi:MFS family permease